MNSCIEKDCHGPIFRTKICRKHYRLRRQMVSDSPTYTTWINMKKRCSDKNLRNYHRYGGRGITVCDRWVHSFKNFIEDLGEKPVDYSLDRVDNNGNYEPGNCRWATRHQQCANRVTNGKCVGVFFTNQYKRWEAQLQYNGKFVLRRKFKSFDAALQARKAAEIKYGILIS